MRLLQPALRMVGTVKLGCQNCSKARQLPALIPRSCFSYNSLSPQNNGPQSHTEYQVLVSTCHNVYSNLSLEDWIYDHSPISDGTGLLILWRNNPCIVIGRHQNPWLECDVPAALHRGVDIARRKSGGGTVYHDMGNLNITFVTPRKKYNRERNLDLIATALQKNWNLDVSVSERDDIILNGKYKISGTASKLGRNVAYHHCTLLFDVNKDELEILLRSICSGVESRATDSVRAEICNMKEVKPNISYDGLVKAIANQYLDSYDTQGEIEYVDPTRETNYPGIYDLYNHHRAWDWLYGKTPKFTITKTYHQPHTSVKLTIQVTIEKGLIKEPEMSGDFDSEFLRLVEGCILGSAVWPRGQKETEQLVELGTSETREQLLWIARCLDHIL